MNLETKITIYKFTPQVFLWLFQFHRRLHPKPPSELLPASPAQLYKLPSVMTNKEAHGGKGSMIAIIKGTDVHTVTSEIGRAHVSSR